MASVVQLHHGLGVHGHHIARHGQRVHHDGSARFRAPARKCPRVLRSASMFLSRALSISGDVMWVTCSAGFRAAGAGSAPTSVARSAGQGLGFEQKAAALKGLARACVVGMDLGDELSARMSKKASFMPSRIALAPSLRPQFSRLPMTSTISQSLPVLTRRTNPTGTSSRSYAMKKRPPWLNRWVRMGSCTRPTTCSMKRETWRESLR